MTPLTLASIDDLIGELFTRFDHAVFVGQATHTTLQDQEIFRANGNRRLCQGLCAGAILTIDRLHQDDAQPIRLEDQ